jgi:hypothetical protein
MREFIVNVSHDDNANVWVAECNEIPAITESSTLDTLYEQFTTIASEIAVLNKLVDKIEDAAFKYGGYVINESDVELAKFNSEFISQQKSLDGDLLKVMIDNRYELYERAEE